jgi:hypothetical protein
VRAGRRFGKTTVKSETMIFKAVARAVRLAREVRDRSVIFIAPTQKQARSIVWSAFRSRLAGIGDFNESRLEIKLPTEDGGTSTIFIGGWENRENYRGMPNVVHIEFDEVDTMKDFFMGWTEIFRPMLIDTGGSASFGGTPKKENPNLRRLEKEAEGDPEWEAFHFTTRDNPHIPESEVEKARQDLDDQTFRQEILAEHVENAGALFRYDALVDVFSNTVTKEGGKFLIVDVADDGSDKTVFSLWDGLEEYRREEYAGLNSEAVISQIREIAAAERIPYSHIAVDAIGVGASVASNSLLSGVIGFKSSHAPFKTDADIVRLPGVSYREGAPALTSDFQNLRAQCVFTLAEHVNSHKLASRVTGRFKEAILEELPVYQDASKGDGKRMPTKKEEVREVLGRSPDHSDTWIMRMYFVVRGRLSPEQSPEFARLLEQQRANFDRNRSTNRRGVNSSR